MIERFLNLKHWQLLIVLLGPFFMFFVILTVRTLIDSSIENHYQTFRFTLRYGAMVILYTTVIPLCWYWSISMGLTKKTPFALNTTPFKIVFWLLLSYLTLLYGALIYVTFTPSIAKGFVTINLFPNPIVQKLTYILPITHLLALCCFIYLCFFSAKVIKTVTLQNLPKFSNVIGTCLALLLYCFGIWRIQPKINKLACAKAESITSIGTTPTV
jgi:hypothetical protein